MQEHHYLKTYRLQKNLTQRQLAKLLGISWQMISHIERGRRGITIENAMAWQKRTNGELKPYELCPILKQFY